MKVVSWEEANVKLLSIREAVFVHEQKVPIEEEVDEHDPIATHFLVYSDQQQAIATARLMYSSNDDIVKIGRMAVLKSFRNQGVGSQLMEYITSWAKINTRVSRLTLSAQVKAIHFYRALGFNSTGEVFMDAGIKHKMMTKYLS